MNARARLTLGTLVLSAAVLLTAWKGTFDWMGIAAFTLALGFPEARRLSKKYLPQLLKLYARKNGPDNDTP